MTLTIDETKIELPPPVQAALEADAHAQARPIADVLAERLADSYGLTPSAEDDLTEADLEPMTAEDVAAVERELATLGSEPGMPFEDWQAHMQQTQAQMRARIAQRTRTDAQRDAA